MEQQQQQQQKQQEQQLHHHHHHQHLQHSPEKTADDMKTVLTDLRLYITRPIIPFCFGIPLLLPATLLTVVAFLQNYISTTLHVLGFLFLSMAIFSIVYGMVLGFHDVCRNKTVQKRPTTKGFQRVKRKILKKSISPESASMSNSQSSSRCSSCSTVSLVVTNEMIRLVPQKGRKNKGRKNRFPTRINILPSKNRLMPSVQEEDNIQTSENTDIARKSLRSSQTERSLEQLEKHLQKMGLGEINRDLTVTPTTLEAVPPMDSGYKTARPTSVWGNSSKGHSRTKSLPEKDIRKITLAPYDTREPIVSGSVEEEDLLRRSARAARRQQEANQQQQQQQQNQQPVLISESHERTGVRICISSTIL